MPLLRRFIAAASLLYCATAFADSGKVDAAVARALVAKTIEQIESQGLPPVSKQEYDAAKRRLRASVAGNEKEFDRQQLYRNINQMLQTIDSGGHTMLWTHEVSERSARSAPSLDTMPRQMRVIDTAQGAALVVNLPAIRVTTPESIEAYIKTALHSIAATNGLERSCALVVDLSGQTGGAAWPQMVVLQPLFTPDNTARFVNRDNVRYALANMRYIESMKARIDQLPPNALERFRGQKFGVVYAPVTASAGEMIAVALLGESGRSRSFGAPTYGLTTGNVGVTMPDNSRLMVTTVRYALGDSPAIRGKLLPDVPAPATTAVQQAAEWVTEQSPACKAQAMQD